MGFYLGVNGLVHGFCKWVLPWLLSGSKKRSNTVLDGYKNCATIGFYTGWKQVVSDSEKGSKWFKKCCTNQVLYGCQAGSKNFIWVLCAT